MLIHGGESRGHERRKTQVAIPHDGEVLRDGDSKFLGGLTSGMGEIIINSHHRGD